MSHIIAAGQRLALAWVMIQLLGCNQAANKSNSSSSTNKVPPSSTTSQTLASIKFETLTPSSVYTSDAGTNNCAAFRVSATDTDKKPIENVSIDITLAGVDAAGLAEWGKLSSKVVTDSSGVASGTFCAALQLGNVILVATSGKLTSNSGVVTVTKKPFYTLTYRNSDFDQVSPKPAEVLNLNLIDSGPNDCGSVYFLLKKLEEPVANAALKFKSDFGYPAGAKLRVRASTDTPYEVDTQTQKSFLSYSATSDTDGILKVPVCAGQLPGSFIVFANYTDEYGKSHYVKSPTISVSSGVANLLNLALNFDSTNARTLKALFNNEVPQPLNFVAKVSSLFGGPLSVFSPVYVNSESGSVNTESGGVPDASGSVKFSVLASYNGTYRPTPVRIFNNSAAQATCDPEAIAADLGASESYLSYFDLSKNWQSTMVYMVRGQEPFLDANKNNKYDVGGDGFWDKNQDGAYTQGVDAVTYFGTVAAGAACRCITSRPGVTPKELATPAQGVQSEPCTEDPSLASCFRRNSEWFVDLPTPFIDADENGIYEPLVAGNDMDRLIGDVYQKPNGSRDVDTLVWKSTTLPVYTGTSPYAMRRSAIAKGATLTSQASMDEKKAVSDYYNSLLARKLDYTSKNSNRQSTEIDLDGTTNMIDWGGGAYSGWRYVHAHGICGTPAPGGTEISATPVLISEPYGGRTVTTHFYMQTGDAILDPSRRLLADGTGGSSTKLNFNISDHASAVAGFPVDYEIKVAPCNRPCSGGTGVWCSEATYRILTKMDSDTVGTDLYVPEYDMCTCKPTYIRNSATGNCDEPSSSS
jgi:hypothetical protein